MKPRLRLTDPSFRYVNAARTDIRKTFRKERERIAAEQARERAGIVEPKVTPIAKGRK